MAAIAPAPAVIEEPTAALLRAWPRETAYFLRVLYVPLRAVSVCVCVCVGGRNAKAVLLCLHAHDVHYPSSHCADLK